MNQQQQNRQQRRAAERQQKKQLSNLRTDSLSPLNGMNTLNSDLLTVSEGSVRLSPTGPFLNPETQRLQTEPWIPPTIESPILPQELPISGLENGGNNTLPEGLEPLKPKEQKLATDLSGLYYLIGTIVNFASSFGGKAIILQAPILSESHVRMARHIPQYYKFLETLVQYNDYIPCITSHLAVVAAIMTHHDLVPEAAKAHFKQLGSEVTQKVQFLELMEMQANAANGTGQNPFTTVS